MKRAMLFLFLAMSVLWIIRGIKAVLLFLVVTMIALIIITPILLIFLLYKTYKEAIRSNQTTSEWLNAQKLRIDFIEQSSNIDHPTAQKLIELETIAYKRWLDAHPSCKKDVNYLINLRKMSKKRRHLQSVS